MGCAISPDAAVACAKKCLKRLQNAKGLYCSKRDSDNLFDEILNGRRDADKTKNLWLTPLSFSPKDKPGESADVLFVMVYRNVY